MQQRRAGTLFGLALLALSCEAEIPNPSGSCTPPNDGSRAGYHAPAGSQWLPDCQKTLRREYWRVFATDSTSSYTMPRLDGNPEFQPACSDPQHELAPLTKRYPLCSAAMTSQEVDQINDMSPADAMILVRFMHKRLRFNIDPQGSSITPWPIPADIVDACRLHPQTNSADLTAICEREKDRLRSGHSIAFAYEGPGAVELVARLNELYGIM